MPKRAIKFIPTILGGVVRAVTTRQGKKIVRKVGNKVTEKSSFLNVREAGEPINTEVVIAYGIRAAIAIGLIKLLDVIGIEISQFFDFMAQISKFS